MYIYTHITLGWFCFRGRLRVHTEINSNIVVVRLAPGFNDKMLQASSAQPTC